MLAKYSNIYIQKQILLIVCVKCFKHTKNILFFTVSDKYYFAIYYVTIFKYNYAHI